MPNLLAQKSKFKSNNYISIQILIINNKKFQIIIAKNMLSNNGAIDALDNSKSFSFVIFAKCLHSCKNKCINKNKDNNKSFDPITLIKYLNGCRNKHDDKNNKNNDLGSQTVTILSAAYTKRLVKYKIAYAVVYSNLNKKTKILTSVTIIQQLRSDFFIPVILTKSIHSYKSKCISIKSNINSLVKNSFYISIIQYLYYQQNC